MNQEICMWNASDNTKETPRVWLRMKLEELINDGNDIVNVVGTSYVMSKGGIFEKNMDNLHSALIIYKSNT